MRIIMKHFLIFLAVFGTSHIFVDAMHGGTAGKIEQVPYMAEMYEVFENGELKFCGAAILSEHWILTAAHCVRREENLAYRVVRVKTHDTIIGEDGEVHNISRIVPYQIYSTETRWNGDVALVELLEPIKHNEKSQIITISKKSPEIGDMLSISGYGNDYEEYGWILKLGQQKVISREACREAYKEAPQGNVTIDERVFCTNSTTLDLCGGDSGSPGVINGKLAGVAAEGCESPLPNIYVNVAYYYDWIVAVTGLKFD